MYACMCVCIYVCMHIQYMYTYNHTYVWCTHTYSTHAHVVQLIHSVTGVMEFPVMLGDEYYSHTHTHTHTMIIHIHTCIMNTEHYSTHNKNDINLYINNMYYCNVSYVFE